MGDERIMGNLQQINKSQRNNATGREKRDKLIWRCKMGKIRRDRGGHRHEVSMHNERTEFMIAWGVVIERNGE